MPVDFRIVGNWIQSNNVKGGKLHRQLQLLAYLKMKQPAEFASSLNNKHVLSVVQMT
jgi:hypothetical protein